MASGTVPFGFDSSNFIPISTNLHNQYYHNARPTLRDENAGYEVPNIWRTNLKYLLGMKVTNLFLYLKNGSNITGDIYIRDLFFIIFFRAINHD